MCHTEFIEVLLPNRHGSVDSYSYGFQGQEKDDEIKGEVNSINYKFRMHDPRLGRFFAVDPLFREYPFYSPYQFSANQVIHSIELEGLENLNNLNANEDEEKFDSRSTLHFITDWFGKWSGTDKVATSMPGGTSEQMTEWKEQQDKAIKRVEEATHELETGAKYLAGAAGAMLFAPIAVEIATPLALVCNECKESVFRKRECHYPVFSYFSGDSVLKIDDIGFMGW